MQKKRLAADTNADWRFWITWYERVLAGQNLHAAEIAKVLDTLTRDEILGDPAAVLPRFDVVLELYEAKDTSDEIAADPFERLKAEVLLAAALSDYEFDGVRRLMKMVPFADDIAVLQDAKALERFLTDAEDMRENIERLAEGLRREGTAMQGAGLVGLELESLLEEFSKARQLKSLNVGKIVKYGEFLQGASQDEATRREFGLAAKRLDQVVSDLLELVRKYFGKTLLRFAPLEQLQLEPDTSAWEYLNELRSVLRDIEAQKNTEDMTGLVPEDVRVLISLADEAERSLRHQASASGPALESLNKEINYRLALLTVSVGLYAASARHNVGNLRGLTERFLKDVKLVKGLWALWKLFRGELL